MPVTATTWHGVAALALENEQLRVVVVPQIGAKIVSLFDKRAAVEWLVGPGTRPFRPVAYGASFEAQDMSGWDEMFPTISACAYSGAGAHTVVVLPDHGEVWALPWTDPMVSGDAITLAVAGRALPYRLTRCLSFAAATVLRFDYHLANLGPDPLPYIWAAHPQFACGAAARIILPPAVRQVCNVLPPDWGWGAAEALYRWPEANHPNGEAARLDVVGSPSLRHARKFYSLPDQPVAWAVLRREPHGAWLRMAWDPQEVPYFGLWIDEGLLNAESVAAPEPATGFYDSLALAAEKQQVAVVAAGAEVRWTLSVQLGTSEEPYE
jgi:hypothetical protein